MEHMSSWCWRGGCSRDWQRRGAALSQTGACRCRCLTVARMPRSRPAPIPNIHRACPPTCEREDAIHPVVDAGLLEDGHLWAVQGGGQVAPQRGVEALGAVLGAAGGKHAGGAGMRWTRDVVLPQCLQASNSRPAGRRRMARCAVLASCPPAALFANAAPTRAATATAAVGGSPPPPPPPSSQDDQVQPWVAPLQALHGAGNLPAGGRAGSSGRWVGGGKATDVQGLSRSGACVACNLHAERQHRAVLTRVCRGPMHSHAFCQHLLARLADGHAVVDDWRARAGTVGRGRGAGENWGCPTCFPSHPVRPEAANR